MTFVSVIVPHYNEPEHLSLMVAALESQTWPRSRIELIVADDGSRVPPVVDSAIAPRIVSQPDRGFRAAAARNLGARAARGDVLCFLDCDTIPEPAYLERAVAPVIADPSALVVGRRLHRHLTGPDAGRELPEPQWLRDGYRHTNDLLDADETAYRYVISAVLTMSRRLFDLTGFDESFTAYGGEDWELGWRAWQAGARFVHLPDAVAVHDGPDWGARSGSVPEKNAESMRLARLITQPSARPAGVRFRRTGVIADLLALGSGPNVVLAASALLEYGDITVMTASVPEALSEDPRVTTSVDADVRAAARAVLTLDAAVLVDADLLRSLIDRLCGGSRPRGCVELVSNGQGVARLDAVRALARRQHWGDAPPVERVEMTLQTADVESRLEARWAGWADGLASDGDSSANAAS